MSEKEFWDIIAPLNPSILGFAFRLLNDQEKAKDIHQDTLEKLWKRRRKLKKEGNIKSLAMTITKNKCIDLIRLEGRYIDRSINELELHTKQDFESKDLIHQIKVRMKQLPTKQQMIIELKDFQGFSNSEIGAIMDMTVNNVRVNLSRARKFLTEQLRHEWQ
ncbi:RNA polymerase sigma factor [Roseivirga sp. E12]|uniref:RNA polymerase sigma factor n=1 Tax=Roseivirga sp. E12 TaxID=2819237 RepID=UPI001ABD1846|nr:sigma-70 family RNA polymerase sigma factor [Roseivirga sp. E12]MBO3697593.1 sigma-70 family RNA polymerase sigma factor [Roseivirga sp. E12]